MFNHVMLGANNLEESKKFYDAVMGALDYGKAVDHPGFDRFTYSSEEGYLVIGLPNDKNAACGANGGTIGFKAANPETIDKWYAAGIANGGAPCEDPPGIRNRGGRKFYAAYIMDPAGNKLCALHWIKN